MAEAKKSAAVKAAPDAYYQIISRQSGKALEASEDGAVYMNDPGNGESQQFGFVPAADGSWRIVSRLTGKVLDVIWDGRENGAQIHQWDETGADNQLWTVETVSRWYVTLKAKASGRCLDIVGMSTEAGARVQIWDDVRGVNQQWRLKEVGSPAKAEAKPAAKKPSAQKPAAKKCKK